VALGSGVDESLAGDGLASSAATGVDDVAPPQGEASLRNLLLLAGLLVVAFGFAFAAGNATKWTGSGSPSQPVRNLHVTAARPSVVAVTPAHALGARKVTPKPRVVHHVSVKPVVRGKKVVAPSTTTHVGSRASAGVSKGTHSPSASVPATSVPAAAPEPIPAPAPSPAPVYNAPTPRRAPSSGTGIVRGSSGTSGRGAGTGISSGGG